VTPQVVALDVDTWENDLGQGGHGYHLDLLTIDCGWKPLAELRPNREFGRQLYETPSSSGARLVSTLASIVSSVASTSTCCSGV